MALWGSGVRIPSAPPSSTSGKFSLAVVLQHSGAKIWTGNDKTLPFQKFRNWPARSRKAMQRPAKLCTTTVLMRLCFELDFVRLFFMALYRAISAPRTSTFFAILVTKIGRVHHGQVLAALITSASCLLQMPPLKRQFRHARFIQATQSFVNHSRVLFLRCRRERQI